MDYVLFTDAACDISRKLLEEWDVQFCEETFTFRGEDRQYGNFDLSAKDFYKRMRGGSVAQTSAVNVDVFLHCFEPLLAAGKDVLYLGFSSGLSTTVNNARIAAEDLLQKYPGRKIEIVDTLAASGGFGLIVYLTAQEKKRGASLEEAARYAEEIKLHVCHWFTVDDLVYLKRGGRVNPALAFVGSMLNIKPVLHTDDEGHLINMFKERGRKASVKALAKKYGELHMDETSPIFISHGDCKEDAEQLRKILEDDYRAKVTLITDIGPIIGAHSGPGTLALFFLGTKR